MLIARLHTIIHTSLFICPPLSFPIMSDEIAPSVSMVSRDLYVRFITEVFSFLKEGDGEIDGTLILERQIKIFGKFLAKVR